jgi:hypothetical protein
MADADGGRGLVLPPSARQVAHSQEAQQSLSARIEAAMARRKEDDRGALAGRPAMRESAIGSASGGLTSRLRSSLGSQPLGAQAVCQVHRWSECGQRPGRVCAVCGLKSEE